MLMGGILILIWVLIGCWWMCFVLGWVCYVVGWRFVGVVSWWM